MRCHDLVAKGKNWWPLWLNIQENKIECVQLALKKSIADVDFSVGNYSGGLAHFVDKKLKDAGVHVSVLGCYINPTKTPNEVKKTGRND